MFHLLNYLSNAHSYLWLDFKNAGTLAKLRKCEQLRSRALSKTPQALSLWTTFWRVTCHLVSLAAVFSIVTPRGGALRDDTKNGCEGDYLSLEQGHFINMAL